MKRTLMKYLIFADIDGTIRNFDGEVPESARETIRQLRRNGHKVLICSGRPLCEIEPHILEIGFDGIVSAGGARVDYDGKILVDEFIPDELLRKFAADLTQNFVADFLTSEKDLVLLRQKEAFEAVNRRVQENLPEGSARLLLQPQYADSIDRLHAIEKITFFGDTVSQDEIRTVWGGRFNFLPFSFRCPFPYGGEILIPGVNKGSAIRSMLEKTGFERQQTIGIGDSENDIEMLEAAGISIAMGNATESAKRAVGILTDPLTEDGFRNAFLRLGLIS